MTQRWEASKGRDKGSDLRGSLHVLHRNRSLPHNSVLTSKSGGGSEQLPKKAIVTNNANLRRGASASWTSELPPSAISFRAHSNAGGRQRGVQHRSAAAPPLSPPSYRRVFHTRLPHEGSRTARRGPCSRLGGALVVWYGSFHRHCKSSVHGELRPTSSPPVGADVFNLGHRFSDFPTLMVP